MSKAFEVRISDFDILVTDRREQTVLQAVIDGRMDEVMSALHPSVRSTLQSMVFKADNALHLWELAFDAILGRVFGSRIVAVIPLEKTLPGSGPLSSSKFFTVLVG